LAAVSSVASYVLGHYRTLIVNHIHYHLQAPTIWLLEEPIITFGAYQILPFTDSMTMMEQGCYHYQSVVCSIRTDLCTESGPHPVHCRSTWCWSTGCANKKKLPIKNSVFQPWEYWFEPNFQTLYMSIQATYPANFIEITCMV